MPAGNTNFSTLITTTLQNLPGDLIDGVSTNNALLWKLKQAGNIKINSGGRQFTHPIIHTQNSTFAARAMGATIPWTIQDNATRAVYDIKTVSGSVAIYEEELAMNAGDKEKLIDLAEEKKQEAEIAMAQVVGTQFFNTSVTAAGGGNMDSIPYLIATVPSSQSDVGGIDSSAAGQASFWRNQVYATTVSAFGTSQAGLNALDILLGLCSIANQGPKMAVTTNAVWTLYMLALTSNARYTSMDEADGAFRKLYYGTIPVYIDANCPTGRWYFIDTENLKLQVLAQGNFKSTKFMPARDQLAQSMLMYLFGNLTCGSRRTQGVVLSITG